MSPAWQVVIATLAGTAVRFYTLKVDYRQYPSYPQGYTIHLSMGLIAAFLGALAVPALAAREFAAASFLGLAATQFREVRKIEREALANLEETELVRRGAAYIEGIARVFEARNYVAMLVALIVSGVLTVLRPPHALWATAWAVLVTAARPGDAGPYRPGTSPRRHRDGATGSNRLRRSAPDGRGSRRAQHRTGARAGDLPEAGRGDAVAPEGPGGRRDPCQSRPAPGHPARRGGTGGGTHGRRRTGVRPHREAPRRAGRGSAGDHPADRGHGRHRAGHPGGPGARSERATGGVRRGGHHTAPQPGGRSPWVTYGSGPASGCWR
ncbi:MAG: YIEGIA domain-containing protein [Limnochordaceae bacterium]|nr:YIEGIA domain-containing protein [Limnochordaceae bacterium]